MAEGTRYKCKNCNYSFNRESTSNDSRCPYCSKVGMYARSSTNDHLFRNV